MLKSYSRKKQVSRETLRMARAYKLRRGFTSLLHGLLVVGICFVILYPLLVKLSTSMMKEQDLYDLSVFMIPRNFTWNNYEIAMEHMGFLTSFRNSLFLCLSTSLLQIVSCTLTAYGFARFEFPFKRLLFAFVIVILVVPPQTIMIPLFLHHRFFDIFGIIKKVRGEPLNLLNTLWPFTLMSATANGLKAGLYIYMLRQYFRGAPKELEEAAYVDGAGSLRTFVQVMLPGAVPMMVTVFLFSFVWQWTDTFYTTLYLPSAKVLPTALAALSANVSHAYSSSDFSGMQYLSPGYLSMINNAASVLVILPLAILYLTMQRYFVEGIEHAGITGI